MPLYMSYIKELTHESFTKCHSTQPKANTERTARCLDVEFNRKHLKGNKNKHNFKTVQESRHCLYNVEAGVGILYQCLRYTA